MKLYAIKPFVWTASPSGESWHSDSAIGGYKVDRNGEQFVWSACFDEWYDEREGSPEPTLEAAQAAAFDDWCCSILPALSAVEGGGDGR